MSLLSLGFLWLLPLAMIPVIIHLLNRLRYRTVAWAAMMFLRQADRESTRRAKLRQWWILAMRVLMLSAFLLALLRPLYEGAFARFFGSGADVVIIAFDRSASMETRVSGQSARERTLELLQTALAGRSEQSRSYFLDSVTRELLPVGRSTDLSALPTAEVSSRSGRMLELLQQAIAAMAEQTPLQGEIWLATDLQASDWIGSGIQVPEELVDRLRVRIMDVGHSPEGNRSLQLSSTPVRRNGMVDVTLKLHRSADAVEETIPVLYEQEGVRIRRDLTAVGSVFEWTEQFEAEAGEDLLYSISIPEDHNPTDNSVYLSVSPAGQQKAELALASDDLTRVCRAGLLPEVGLRSVEPVKPAETVPESGVTLRVQDVDPGQDDGWRAWLEGGGVCLVLPHEPEGGRLNPDGLSGNEALAVSEWEESTGPFRSFRENEGMRLESLEVLRRVELDVGEEEEVLAQHVDGSPFLLRQRVGRGAVYRLSSLPLAEWSNIGVGYLWLPFMQRLLHEGTRHDFSRGTHDLERWTKVGSDDWLPLTAAWDVRSDAGLFVCGARHLALNTPVSEFERSQVTLEEVQALCGDLPVEIFRDEVPEEKVQGRLEISHVFAIAGLLFLLIESILVLRSREGARRLNPLQGGAA